jgi:uncharacterized membrane protein YtjA (UPF0391 family)
MGYLAAACFAITLVASLMGFGGVLGTAVAITKALAVVSLLLFFVTLYRVLAESEPPRSAGS